MGAKNKTVTIINWIWKLSIALSVVLLLAVNMTGTLAWSGGDSSDGDIEDNDLYKVAFTLYEKNLDNPSGTMQPTTTPVVGAKFRLLQDDGTGNIVPIDSTIYTTNAKGQLGTTANGDDRVRVRRLRAGTYYLSETKSDGTPGFPYGYKYDTDTGGNDIAQYKIVVNEANCEPFDDTDPSSEHHLIKMEEYNQRLYADLFVKKTIVNKNGASVSDEQKSLGFSFAAIFDDGKEHNYHVTDIDGVQGPVKTLAPDKPLFTLKHGETATFIQVPVGVKYTITEAPVTGYTITTVNNSGNIPDGGITAEFTNTYDGSVAQSGALIIDKKVFANTGVTINDNKEFTFNITFENDNNDTDAGYHYKIVAKDGTVGAEQELVNGTIVLKDGERAAFTDVPEGAYYTVVEVDPNNPLPAAPEYIQGMNKVTGTVVGQDIAKALFHNYQIDANDPDIGTLKVSKTIAGTVDKNKEFEFSVKFTDPNDADSTKVYHYQVYDENGATVGTVQDLTDNKIVLKSGQYAMFTDIPVGVTYTVEEADYTSDGYIPGVKSVLGTIAPGDTAEANFYNARQQAGGPGKLIVKKIVEGEEADLTKKFEFTVTINGTEEKVMLANDEKREFELPAGAVYKVIEKDYYEDGYRQSAVVNGYGTGTGSTVEVIMTNIYTGKETPDIPDEDGLKVGSPTVQKIINTEETIPKPAEFKFILEAKDNAPMPKGASNGKKSAKITGAGEIDFESIVYPKAGTYEYTITEENTHVPGYTYDTSVYNYIVVVTDTDGVLSSTRTLTKVGEPAFTGDKAVFTNSYSSKDVPFIDGGGDGSGGSGGSSGGRAPKTSDTMSPILWFILMVLSACITRSFLFRCLADKELKSVK